jgi:predicted TPR repeat methyltransferase
MMGKAETDHWIDQVYNAPDQKQLTSLYDQWAANYDADMQQIGYLHAPVITGLISRHVPQRDAAMLDAGVGTGAIGNILSLIGYNNLSGIDMSQGMLEVADKRGVYTDLRQGVLGETLPFPDGAFDAIYSTGTFTNGHAPASAFPELVRILEPGGVLLFTVGTIIWEEKGFRHMLDALTRNKSLELLETTPIYCPMPFSETESGFTTRAHVYRKT